MSANSLCMNFNVNTILNKMDPIVCALSESTSTAFSYFAWWWSLWTEICPRIFNTYHYLYCCVTVWNKLLYYCNTQHNGSYKSYENPFLFCLSVRPSARSHANLHCQRGNLCEILCCVSLKTLVEIFTFPSAPNKSNRCFTSRLMYSYLISSLLNFIPAISCALCVLPAETQKHLLTL